MIMANELIKYTPQQTLTRWQDGRSTGMVEVYRALLQVPEVVQSLTPAENRVLTAASHQQIKYIPKDILANTIAQALPRIAKDMGVQKNLQDYEIARLFDIIARYYGDLTPNEIKAAFELLSLGELKEYISDQDKHHFQSFDMDYLNRVLIAYRHRKNAVVIKARAALPPPAPIEFSTEYVEKSNENVRKGIVQAFENFKETNHIHFPGISQVVWEMFAYNELERIGKIESIEIDPEDESQAVGDLLRELDSSEISRYEAHHIKQQGTQHHRVPQRAHTIARRKAILKAFQNMSEENYDLSTNIHKN